MKLNNLTVAVVSKTNAGFGQNEGKAERLKRMTEFWAAKPNAILHPLGNLLAMKVGKKRLADLLIDGETLEFGDTLQVNGKSLPLAPGFAISLQGASVAQVWGCPACRSAHGSGVYPSRVEPDADALARNKFYYRPSDRAVFVISDTCFVKYAKALGAVTAARFVSLVPSTAQAVPAVAK